MLSSDDESHAARAVVVGAGPAGRETARALRDRGHQVTVVTRSGRSPGIEGVDSAAVDAADPQALVRAVDGADALVNCANPSDYTSWDRVWPPLAASLLGTAERTGATLVTASALYAYGPVDEPMVEGMPDRATDHKGRLRAGMWADALAAHRAGRIRAVEVRASDYVGAGVRGNGHISRLIPTAVRGRTAWVIGDPDLPHTFTDVADMGAALATVAFAENTWGQVWHAPSQPARSQRRVLTDVLATMGRPPVTMRPLPEPVLRLIGVAVPLVREINEAGYMFRRPYVMESGRTESVLGLSPSPWPDIYRRTGEGNG